MSHDIAEEIVKVIEESEKKRKKNWSDDLTSKEREYFDKWMASYESRNEFYTWMDEKQHHERGDPFYGRSWDDHVKRCKESGRDPYD